MREPGPMANRVRMPATKKGRPEAPFLRERGTSRGYGSVVTVDSEGSISDSLSSVPSCGRGSGTVPGTS